MKKFLTVLTILGAFAPNVTQADVTFVGSCSNNGNNGANATLTLPVGTAENDLVIVAYGNADADNLDLNMVMVTADYTEVADLFSNDTNDANMGVYWKVMGVTPDTQAVADNIGGADTDTPAVCMVFRGVDTTTPMDVTPTTVTTLSTFSANPPSINHNNPSGVWTVIAGANAHTLGAASTFTFPTGYTTDAVQIVGDDTVDGSVGLGYRSSSVSDPEDPGTMTYSGTDNAAFASVAATLALRPLPDTAPTVTTQAASSITETTATLNGNITDAGNPAPTVRGFAWGTNSSLSGGDTATTTENGTFSTGAFTAALPFFPTPIWTANTDWDGPDDVGGFAAPALADLDNDGDFDLMLGDSAGIADGYQNTGTVSSLTWTSNDDWDSPNVADWAAPTLADLDNDGDLDMMIGLNGGPVNAYENTGTASSPTWAANTDWDMTDVLTVARPTLADLDNDGDYDMMIGENAGIVLGYENTGTASSPTWTANTGWNTIDMGASPSPTFADIDNDGDFDMMVGEVGGLSEGFENTGTASSPTWTANTDWDTTGDVGDWAAPTLADLDNDNDYDLMVGNGSGFALGYENTATAPTELTCGMTYYVRAYATNTAGTGHGSIETFDTSACPSVSPPTVATNAETNVGVSSATLNGTVSNDGGEPADTVGFAYGTDSALATVIATTTESGTFATSATFDEFIQTLKAGTTYYFRAYATNSGGTGFGSIDNFTTGTDTSISRIMRLFEGFSLKLFSGRIILFQQ